MLNYNTYLEQLNLLRTFPTMSKMTTLMTLHSTTMMRPQLSVVTPRGCCRMSAPNFRMNCPYLVNTWTCSVKYVTKFSGHVSYLVREKRLNVAKNPLLKTYKRLKTKTIL